MQIGATGKVKFGELYVDGAKRELYEECRMFTNKIELVEKEKYLHKHKEIQIHHYTTNIIDCYTLENDKTKSCTTCCSNCSTFFSKNKDDNSRKMSIIAYGSKTDIHKIFCEISKIKNHDDGDNICYLMAVPKHIILILYDLIYDPINKDKKIINININNL